MKAFSPNEFYTRVTELLSDGELIPFATLTLVDLRGSAPQEKGAKMIVAFPTHAIEPFTLEGTIGGGKVEAKAIEEVKTMLYPPPTSSDSHPLSNPLTKTKFVQWNLQKDVGMTCGGEVKIFMEVFNHKSWEIVIFGAGHVSQALIPLLLTLNCRITCYDTRKEWLEKLPENSRLKKFYYPDLPAQAKNLSPQAFVISMTKGHATDLPILKELLTRPPFPYLGVIGSKAKSLILRRELLKEGFAKELVEGIFCPIGLPLGGNSPSEIALSIGSQLLQQRDQVFKGKPASANTLTTRS